MAVEQYQPQNVSVYMGLAADTKPAAGIGSKFVETDTSKVYLYTNASGGTWVQIGVISPAATAPSVSALI